MNLALGVDFNLCDGRSSQIRVSLDFHLNEIARRFAVSNSLPSLVRARVLLNMVVQTQERTD